MGFEVSKEEVVVMLIYSFDNELQDSTQLNFKLVNSKGFTLLEVLAVFVIFGIFTAIAVPVVSDLIEKSKVRVCNTNTLQVKQMYEMDLHLKGMEHSETVFRQFLLSYGTQVCPDDGMFSYVDGEVMCSIHPIVIDVEDVDDTEDEGSVPFL
ncbi:type II secretion system protein [Bacillus sp. Marseille-P3661]|uniref:type II secretion system protein n=1 Tax=Bacillus sp. Marseille-P3661 TaxID=1936234 RepID=UPI002155024C|nr:type II secretion system protein [Bacillus sp. Marseille-P3661]